MWISGETATTPGRPRARVAVVVGIAERTMSPSEARDSSSATSSRAAPENVVSRPRTKAAVATRSAVTSALAAIVSAVRSGRRPRLRTA